MRWSYQIARVSGIDVKIHVTFFLLLAWYGWMFYQQGGTPAAVQGILFILLLFLCVLLHEFGHAFAAKAYGIRTPDITLLPIGGVARLERMPQNPVQELVIAVAGPAVNVVIGAVIFLVLAAKFNISDMMRIDRAGGDLLVNLMTVNFFLVAFNALPAFPMDGGRVLRSLLAMKFNYVTATTVAARTGQVVAVLFAIGGFFGSPLLIFIAAFVFLGAQQELAYAKFRAGIARRRISEIMQSDVAALPGDATCAAALQLVRFSPQPVFPVLDGTMRAIGVVTLAELADQPWRLVQDVCRPAPSAPSQMSVDDFLNRFQPGEVVIVENPSGQMVGLVRHPGG